MSIFLGFTLQRPGANRYALMSLIVLLHYSVPPVGWQIATGVYFNLPVHQDVYRWAAVSYTQEAYLGSSIDMFIFSFDPTGCAYAAC
jgi:hypothetical protein